MQETDSKIHYSYDDIDLLSKCIVLKSRINEFYPDYVVGISRGGLLPGAIISHYLHVPLVTVTWQTRDTGTRKDSQPWLVEEICNLNKNVLIVDDICDTGITFQTLLQNWQENYTEFYENFDEYRSQIKLAALVYSQDAQIMIDYYEELKTNSKWVVFPWEV